MPSSRLYRARHIFPVSSAAIIDGAVVVDDDRIHAVGTAAEMAGVFPNIQVVDLGDSALLPAAVNAHTHLELTGLAGAIPAGLSFSEWIVALVRLRRSLSHDDYVRAAQNGI